MDYVMDRSERERMIERYLPLVRGLARRYANGGETYEDLVQVGSVGLVAAARRYDPERRVPFAAYAAPTIDGELRRHLRDRSATVRVPRREQAVAASLRRAAAAASQRLGREPSLAETAATAGLTPSEAERALAATAVAAPLSDAELEAADADEIEVCETRALVRCALASLEPLERQAVGLRFAADLSQLEIARRLQISQSQTSRVLGRALEKLRRELEPEAVPDSPRTA